MDAGSGFGDSEFYGTMLRLKCSDTFGNSNPPAHHSVFGNGSLGISASILGSRIEGAWLKE